MNVSTTGLTAEGREGPPPWTVHDALLVAGVVSTVYYATINVLVPMHWPGYSSMSQAVSELSAIGAPTRGLWVTMCVPYSLLMIAFGYGVWMSGAEDRRVRIVGWLFMAQGVVGAFWPPMHLRGAEQTLTDTLHIVWTGGWLATLLAAMGLAAAALGRRFRAYTFVTLATFVGFGMLTSRDGVRLASDLPTPYLGLWERINMAAGMLWIAALATVLLRRRRATGYAGRGLGHGPTLRPYADVRPRL